MSVRSVIGPGILAERYEVRVLIFGADPFTACWLADRLERAGFGTCDIVSDEDAAVALIGEDPPDAAILVANQASGAGEGAGTRSGPRPTGQGVAMALSDHAVPYVLVSERPNLVMFDRRREALALSSTLDDRAVLEATSRLVVVPADRRA